ncbi:SAM-dependent methyltransferase, partial [Staphylococcus epidermidis]
HVHPNDPFTLLDPTSLKQSALNLPTNTLITQLYTLIIPPHLKLTLIQTYPHHFNLKIITASHTDAAHVIESPLYQIHRYHHYFNNLTTLFIPKINHHTLLYQHFHYPLQTIHLLLHNQKPSPSHKLQTHHSLKRYLL